MAIGLRLLAASLVLLPVGLSAQDKATVSAPLPAIPMPQGRAAESYLIYSSLIPLGETAGWAHDLWLVQDTTISLVPPDQPCWHEPEHESIPGKIPDTSMNPHVAVHPPASSKQDFEEILADFDAHCHDRLTLDPDSWKTVAPVHLMTPAEQKEYESSLFTGSPVAAKYKGAPGLYGFSEVYFNAHHTVALVYATHWCGGLCGEGFWIAVGLKDGAWKQLPWSAARWIS